MTTKVKVKRVEKSLFAPQFEEPALAPADWDYDTSVKKVKRVVYKWHTLTEDLYAELAAAREVLSAQAERAGRPKGGANAPRYSWSGYCQAIGCNKSTVNRWLANWGKRLLPKPKPTPPLPEGMFNVIYADPPWKYDDKCETGGVQGGGAIKHYPLMSTQQLCEMPVGSIVADNAVLFLWVTSPILEESQLVIPAWGFEYKASFIWDKIKHNMGHYNSVRHEFLLICTRGSFLPQNKKLFDSVQSIERTKHSEKPEEFRQIIETLYPDSDKLELFARKQVQGWTVYGNEC